MALSTVQTELDICNLAIDRIGGERIDAIGEDTPLGEYCQRSYGHKRDWLMGKHRWVCFSQIAELNRLTTTPAGCPLAYGFNRPADLVGAIHAFRDGASSSAARVDAIQMADFIAADTARLFAEHTARKPEATWPVWFRELVIVAFGADLARLNQQRGLADDLNGLAFGTPSADGEGGLYLQAKIEDGRNAPQRGLYYDDPGPLIGARYGASRWPFGGGVTVTIED